MGRFAYDHKCGLMLPRERRVEPVRGRALEMGAPQQALFMSGVETPTDPNFNDVSILLPFHDPNGSTTITDYSPRPKTVTPSGTGNVSNTVTKFGNNSYRQDAVGDYMGTPNNAEFDPVAGDFTIEFFVQFTTISSQTLVMKAIGTGVYPYQVNISLSKFNFLCFNNSSSLIVNLTGTTTVTTGVLYFVQARRSGNDFALAVDGVQEATSNPGSHTLFANTGKFNIGGDDVIGGNPLRGYVNNFRFTKGVARTFAVPTAQWPEA